MNEKADGDSIQAPSPAIRKLLLLPIVLPHLAHPLCTEGGDLLRTLDGFLLFVRGSARHGELALQLVDVTVHPAIVVVLGQQRGTRMAHEHLAGGEDTSESGGTLKRGSTSATLDPFLATGCVVTFGRSGFGTRSTVMIAGSWLGWGRNGTLDVDIGRGSSSRESAAVVSLALQRCLLLYEQCFLGRRGTPRCSHLQCGGCVEDGVVGGLERLQVDEAVVVGNGMSGSVSVVFLLLWARGIGDVGWMEATAGVFEGDEGGHVVDVVVRKEVEVGGVVVGKANLPTMWTGTRYGFEMTRRIGGEK